MICYVGWNGTEYQDFIRRYCDSVGQPYKFVGIKDNFWTSASVLKKCRFAFIWNGRQHNAPLAGELCRRRGIPHCYIEWGWLPQSETLTVDPRGMCDQSVLMEDLSWVSQKDVDVILTERQKLQQQYPLKPGGHVLVPLQIENDTSVLYTCNYATMDEFVDDVRAMYPSQKVVFRPHPKSTRRRPDMDSNGTWLEAAAGASAVVGLTSTCLLESALLGVPTFALGDCPLRHHSRSNVDRLLAGYWALRVRRDGSPQQILERFGLRPL